MKHLFGYFLSLAILLYCPQVVWGQGSPSPSTQAPSGKPEKIFKTKYSVVHYSDKQDIDDFIWRLGGQKLEVSDNPQLASSRIDRIVNRVEALLDMWPENPHLDVEYQAWKGGPNVNAIGRYILGLMHTDDHIEQISEIVRQAHEARGIVS